MEPMGVSFMPGEQDESMKRPGSEAPQDAIKTLNLAIPRVVGAGSPVNPSMLFGAGSQGLPANGFGGLEAFLRRLFGQMQQGPVSPGGAPLPPAGPGGRVSVPPMEPGAPQPPMPPGTRVPGPGFQFDQPGADAPPSVPPPDKSIIDLPRASDGFNF